LTPQRPAVRQRFKRPITLTIERAPALGKVDAVGLVKQAASWLPHRRAA